MTLLEICPTCGFKDTMVKKIDKIIKINNDTIVINVEVEVCNHCGEKIFDPKTIEKIEKIKKQFMNNKLKIEKIGNTYKIAV